MFMRLLILTQKVDMDDDLLGFFHDWLVEFAKRYEKITVVCLQKGKYDLPGNIKVLSLGKENGRSRLKYVKNFYRYIFALRHDYDAVFIHMNVEYMLLGGLFWRRWKKPIGFWYVHRKTNWKLILAEKLANKIFTSAQKSFQLASKKIIFAGHGIDIKKFKIQKSKFKIDGRFKIIYVGRISPIKNQALLIQAANILVNQENFKHLEIVFIGAPLMPGDGEYLAKLKNLADDYNLRDQIQYAGSVPNRLMPPYYQVADLALNLCPTGGVDKSVLEAMACSLPVLALNKSFEAIFGQFADNLMLKSDQPEELAKKIKWIHDLAESYQAKIAPVLSQKMAEEFSVEKVVKIIADNIK